MAGPDISVVIPVFNGQRFLAPTLHAVLAQQGVALELIVVDDGSTDGSPATVRRVAPQARLIEQRNAGVCAARNRGLAEARGRAVIFLDQDDIWHPLMLARELAVLDADPERVAAVCPYHHWRPGSGVSGESGESGESGAYPDPASVWGAERPCELDPDFTGWVYHQFLFDCWALTSATLLRRDAVQALGGFDVNLPFSEDWDLWLRLSRRGTFALLNWPSVLYRHHAVQGSREVRDRDWRVELLKKNAAEHGLASRDGRAMDPTRFQELLARYEAAFGYHHLAHGDRDRGARAMLAAWRRRPLHLARLAKGLAGLAGWRPG